MEGVWLGTREAAEELGISLRTLYRLIDEGSLIAYQIGRNLRIRRSDLDAFLESARVRPGDLGVRRPGASEIRKRDVLA